jgi:hypothetical protein
VYASFKQGSLANNKYYKKFKALVTNAEQLGSDIGAHSDQTEAILEEIAADPDLPTDAKRGEQAWDLAKDQFLTVMFLVNSDHAHYGSLVQDIENEYTRGSDTYPTTLSAAYDYLVNYWANSKISTTHNPDESGLSYNTTQKTMMVLDGIKVMADAELVMERVAAEAIVEDVATDMAARLAMAAVVLAASHPDLKDVCAVRLMMPPMMMCCSIRKRQKAEWSLFLVILVLELMSNDPFI